MTYDLFVNQMVDLFIRKLITLWGEI